MAKLSPLALAVLVMLSERPMHPYEIGRLMRSRGKDQSIKIRYGSLYTVVQNLEKQGLVEADGTDRAGNRPERTVYSVTGTGREAMDRRLSEIIELPEKEYPAFEGALSLVGVLGPDRTVELLERRLAALERELAEGREVYDHLISDLRLPRLFLIEVEYAAHQKRAEADWVRGLLTELKEETIDGMSAWRSFFGGGGFPEEWKDRPFAASELGLNEEAPEN
ncbi:PadR family transcriptional regulator [Actinocorallia longicatena]|uniref:PadR family transcriptional regulator n=1 Tax=Actinocorallia longicatena TaxID=111803 RepID=A0ABP6Q118_9ACTN